MRYSINGAVKSTRRCYRLSVPKSPILPLAAAVTAVALGASPALATSTSPGKRDEAKVVAFPLLAMKGYASANFESHVSHSSHVSGSGGHVSHVSHSSHVSSINAPAPPVTSAPPPAPPPAPVTTPPNPVYSSSAIPTSSAGGSPAVAPSQSGLTVSPGNVESSSPAASKGGGCAFIIVAPFGVFTRGVKWLARRGRVR